jgi:hypothetical protein
MTYHILRLVKTLAPHEIADPLIQQRSNEPPLALPIIPFRLFSKVSWLLGLVDHDTD